MSDKRDRQLTVSSYAPVARAVLVATPLFVLILAGVDFLEVGSKHERVVVGTILISLISLAGFVYSIGSVIREDRHRDA